MSLLSNLLPFVVGLIFFAKFVCLLCFGFLLLRDPAMLLGSVVKSGGERRKRSCGEISAGNNKMEPIGSFPVSRVGRCSLMVQN